MINKFTSGFCAAMIISFLLFCAFAAGMQNGEENANTKAMRECGILKSQLQFAQQAPVVCGNCGGINWRGAVAFTPDNLDVRKLGEVE
jgi:thymidine phosphorylase